MLTRNLRASDALLDAGHGGAGDLPPESDKLPVGFLTVAFIAITVVLVVVAVGARQLLWSTADKQIEEVSASVPNPELVELRQKEAAELGEYDVVDEAKGFYRIPINQAIEVYARGQGANGGQ